MFASSVSDALRAAAKGLVLVSAPLALAGCAAPSEYAGIPLAPGATDLDTQSLARRAGAGDKHAQLELGIRFEEGRGVPVDNDRARNLYRAAATTSGGPLFVYVPAVGKAPARVLRRDGGPVRPGLEEARARLRRLDAAARAR